MMPAVAGIVEESRHLPSSVRQISGHNISQPHLNANTLLSPLKMVSEPQHIKPTSPRLGISRSQEEQPPMAHLEVEATPHFGRVSPTLSSHVRNTAAQAAPRAANLRLKFRKSHTCGSLYANCSCSSPPPLPLNSAAPTFTPAMAPTQCGNTYAADAQRLALERSSYAAAPSSFNFSLSPTGTDASCISCGSTTSTRRTSSGIYSLSTQTSSATSAQLSRDESINASFDWWLGGAAAPAAAGDSFDNGCGHSATPQQRQHSPVGARLASVTEHVVATTQSLPLSNSQSGISSAHTLQVPRISSPDTAEPPSTSLLSSSPAATAPVPTSSAISPTTARKSERKAKRFFQSYSHPDTDYIFTDANKHPSRESLIQIHVQQQHSQEPVIKTRGGKVEIKQPKRSSSPNIGQYQILDVAVHPDILVKISPKHSPVPESRRSHSPSTGSTRSAQQRRRLLQRSHEIESGGSTSESEYSLDVKQSPPPSEVQELRNRVKEQRAVSPTTRSRAAVASAASLNAVVEDASFDAAQKYFAESGILGPINTASPLIRKTSKILQDSNVIEQIRKTSMILRANNSAINHNNNNSSQNNNISSNNSSTRQQATSSPTTPHAPTGAYSKALLLAPSLAVVPAQPNPMKLQLGNYSNNNSNVNMETPATIIYASAPTTTGNTNGNSNSSTPQSPHTMATTCGFSPNMTTKSCTVTDDRDAQIKSLQGELVSLKDVIKARDAEIVKLRREIHKLKSVLQQTASPLPIPSTDPLQSPTSPTANRFLLSSSNSIGNGSATNSTNQQQICATCKQKLDQDVTRNSAAGRLTPESSSSIDSNISADNNYNQHSSSNSTSTSTGNTTVTCALVTSNNNSGSGNNNAQHVELALDAAEVEAASTTTTTTPTATLTAAEALSCCNGLKPKLTPNNGAMQQLHAPVLKKQGVSGESCETSMQQSINVPIPQYDKDYSAKQLIKDAIMDNDFLKNIDASQVRELVESMYPLSIAKGEFVIREGEAGAHLYVSAEGEFEVVKGGQVLSVMGPGKAFGELAILYNCTRTASIRVLCEARVWVLDRRVFQQIMMRTGMQRIENSVNFLKSVPLLKNLSMEVLAKIADVLEVEFYPAGTYIIRQGASGDTFFLISQGCVQVTQKLSPSSEEKEIRTLQRGDYFGEQALINEDKRTANIIAMAPGVECLTLDRDSFTQLIGDLCELKEKNYGDENRVLAMKFAEKSKEIFGANVKQEFPGMQLTDLEVVATLGIGGFGRVELVKAYQENRVDIFALKCLKKKHIVDTKQEEHVFSERTIMLTCNSPFICRLHRTFRDEKYVYMLLEACMGGEIWTMLRDRGSFDENATQFIIGCVLQAFEYLHARGIIYRDLKPENLMLDERGYVKLVDFGFAKYIGNSNKTWTFCGTPEYVAPEIILNKGHDRAVDYWALGILIHELLNGTPPFTANDPMKTYNIILKGIDMIDFPKHMSRSAIQLIKKLCRDVPAERLGYQKGGIQYIKKHKWFLGFDWDGLEEQLLIPPFVRPIAHPTDTCYFDKFPCDPEEPHDELSGWDADF